jgi:hypothetical protein
VLEEIKKRRKDEAIILKSHVAIRAKWLWLARAISLEKYNTSGPIKAASTPGFVVTLFIAEEASFPALASAVSNRTLPVPDL